MKTNRQNNLTRIAVPYYGALSLPPSGLSRVFFLVEVNLESETADNISLQVWNPKTEPNLSSWLRQLNTDGVICSDNPSQYEIALNAEGIWVQWKQAGEVHEVVDRWIRSRPTWRETIMDENPVDSKVPWPLKPAWHMS